MPQRAGSTVQAQPERIDCLTSLRGAAALWVVLFHYTHHYFLNIHSGNYTHIIDKGYLAVDLFFILSGFVLTHVYHQVFKSGVRDGYWRFMKARIARIYPLHLVMLCMFLAASLAYRTTLYAETGTFEMLPLAGTESIGAFFANVLMIQGFKASSLSWNFPAWSITIEFSAYLVFPLVLWLNWRAGVWQRAVLLALIVASLGWLAYATGDDFNQWDGPITLVRCWPEFLTGAIIYTIFHNTAASRILAGDISALLIIAAIVFLLHTGISDVAVVALFALLIAAIAGNAGRISAFFHLPPLIWLGEISYSLYLVHSLTEYVAGRLLQQAFGISNLGSIPIATSVAISASMLAVSFLIASMTYRYVEVTGRRYFLKVL